MGCLNIQLNINSGCVHEVVYKKIRVWSCGTSSDCLPQCGWVLSNPLRARIEPKRQRKGELSVYLTDWVGILVFRLWITSNPGSRPLDLNQNRLANGRLQKFLASIITWANSSESLSLTERGHLLDLIAHTIPPSFGIFFHLLPLWLKSNHAPESTFLMKTFLITSCPSALPQVHLLYVYALSLFLSVFHLCLSVCLCLFKYPIDSVFQRAQYRIFD